MRKEKAGGGLSIPRSSILPTPGVVFPLILSSIIIIPIRQVLSSSFHPFVLLNLIAFVSYPPSLIQGQADIPAWARPTPSLVSIRPLQTLSFFTRFFLYHFLPYFYTNVIAQTYQSVILNHSASFACIRSDSSVQKLQ